MLLCAVLLLWKVGLAQAGWVRVTPNMIKSTNSIGVQHEYASDSFGGLKIRATAMQYGCGSSQGSYLATFIYGDWTKIRYTQTFSGSTQCWAIFGEHFDWQKKSVHSGLYDLDLSKGDEVYNDQGMGSLDQFENKRCERGGSETNFWHADTGGAGNAKATVELRRMNTVNAGLATGTECGTPQWGYEDIFVFMPNWRAVRIDDVLTTHTQSVSYKYTDRANSLEIRAEARQYGCTKDAGSAMVTYLRGDWTKIMYTQSFSRQAPCWAVFGQTPTWGDRLYRSGLRLLDTSRGDQYWNPEQMSDDLSPMLRSKCEFSNSPVPRPVGDSAHVTVILNRDSLAPDFRPAGLSTGVNCGTPSWTFSHIYVYTPPMSTGWVRVTQAMIQSSEVVGANHAYVSDSEGGLKVKVDGYKTGCSADKLKHPGSAMATYILGEWTRIKYTQVFHREALCWSIFGATPSWGGEKVLQAGLFPLDSSKTGSSDVDRVYNMHNMRRIQTDNRLCRSGPYPFANPPTPTDSYATVILRRANMQQAGLATSTECGQASWTYTDIFVYIPEDKSKVEMHQISALLLVSSQCDKGCDATNSKTGDYCQKFAKCGNANYCGGGGSRKDDHNARAITDASSGVGTVYTAATCSLGKMYADVFDFGKVRTATAFTLFGDVNGYWCEDGDCRYDRGHTTNAMTVYFSTDGSSWSMPMNKWEGFEWTEHCSAKPSSCGFAFLPRKVRFVKLVVASGCWGCKSTDEITDMKLTVHKSLQPLSVLTQSCHNGCSDGAACSSRYAKCRTALAVADDVCSHDAGGVVTGKGTGYKVARCAADKRYSDVFDFGAVVTATGLSLTGIRHGYWCHGGVCKVKDQQNRYTALFSEDGEHFYHPKGASYDATCAGLCGFSMHPRQVRYVKLVVSSTCLNCDAADVITRMELDIVDSDVACSTDTTYTVYPGSTIGGISFASYPAYSQAKCEALCNADRDCLAFVMPGCHIKNSIERKASSLKIQSFVKQAACVQPTTVVPTMTSCVDIAAPAGVANPTSVVSSLCDKGCDATNSPKGSFCQLYAGCGNARYCGGYGTAADDHNAQGIITGAGTTYIAATCSKLKTYEDVFDLGHVVTAVGMELVGVSHGYWCEDGQCSAGYAHYDNNFFVEFSSDGRAWFTPQNTRITEHFNNLGDGAGFVMDAKPVRYVKLKVMSSCWGCRNTDTITRIDVLTRNACVDAATFDPMAILRKGATRFVADANGDSKVYNMVYDLGKTYPLHAVSIHGVSSGNFDGAKNDNVFEIQLSNEPTAGFTLPEGFANADTCGTLANGACKMTFSPTVARYIKLSVRSVCHGCVNNDVMYSLRAMLAPTTPSPTPSPTRAPSTPAPSTSPTHAPTAHPCDEGSHDCDKGPGGVCYKASGMEMGWTCGCLDGYWCRSGCIAPHQAHACVPSTAAPTATPSSAPTAAPTNRPTPFPTPGPTLTPTRAPTGASEIQMSVVFTRTPDEAQLRAAMAGVCGVDAGSIRVEFSHSTESAPGLGAGRRLSADLSETQSAIAAETCPPHFSGVCVTFMVSTQSIAQSDELSATIKGTGFASAYKEELRSHGVVVEDLGMVISDKVAVEVSPGVPTPSPTASPSATPSATPTIAPTVAPTPHPCYGTNHGCDSEHNGGICYKAEDGSNSWTCGCHLPYFCSAGCDAPHEGHTCKLITPAPTARPTNAPTISPTHVPTAGPTAAPTPHPCDDGSHGCDQSPGGICYKGEGSAWVCGCNANYWCSAGCDETGRAGALKGAHICAMITRSPTPSPTAAPTKGPTPEPTPQPSQAPTAAPTARPTALPTPAPTPHPCDDGTHGCYKGTGGICYKGEGFDFTCACAQDYWCAGGCSAPHESHECVAVTAHPTGAPTLSPTLQPTLEPTNSPTQYPTHHMCDDGSHGCDKGRGGICYKTSMWTFACGCEEGYHCVAGCGTPHEGHKCRPITPAPTPAPSLTPTLAPTLAPTRAPSATPSLAPTPPSPAPTVSPTKAPTPHPCDDGSHGCEKNAGGICYRGIGEAYTCSCKEGYFCTRNCDNALARLTGTDVPHECTLVTAAPTFSPTPSPSAAPTPQPSATPTTAPTPAPTPHPCDDGSHGCDKGPGSICYKAADGSNGWTCDCEQHYWCLNGCNDASSTHTCIAITAAPSAAPTPSPSPAPTALPSPSPTSLPTFATRTPTPQPTQAPTSHPTTHAPTAAPTVQPTRRPSARPTTYPSASPTTVPTPAPTPHPCDDGTHGCDDWNSGGICYKGAGNSWSCGCGQKYFCKSGCEAPHDGHLCQLITPAPTLTPTLAPTSLPTTAPTTVAPTPAPSQQPTALPTSAPTPHPCEDGSHGCDQGPGGICYKVGQGQRACGCKEGYWCVNGCSAPHVGHNCALTTSSPTPSPTSVPTAAPSTAITAYPTPSPTAHPSMAPTPVPTSSPTAAPTPHPCDNGSHDCDHNLGGICYKGEGKAWTCDCKAGYWCSGGCSVQECTTPFITQYMEMGTSLQMLELMGGAQDEDMTAYTLEIVRGKDDAANPGKYAIPLVGHLKAGQKYFICHKSARFAAADCHVNINFLLHSATDSIKLIGPSHVVDIITISSKLKHQTLRRTVVCGSPVYDAREWNSHAAVDIANAGKHTPHTCHLITASPTPLPTLAPTPTPTTAPSPAPSASPTQNPTARPTALPTPAPTPHPCDDGTHGCYKGTGGICYKGEGFDFTCACAQDYWCAGGCSAPHESHECVAVTAHPTGAPTLSPTLQPTLEPTTAPTPHPCDDGSHGCDHGEGGRCVKIEVESVKSAFAGRDWLCLCAAGYTCTSGCSVPFAGHYCSRITASPTAEPTTFPTAAPSSTPSLAPTLHPTPTPTPAPTRAPTAPTAAPTASPTLAPTLHPCDEGTHGCERAGAGGICYKVDGDSWTCDCRQGYMCTAGCGANQHGHQCALITVTPTPQPTRAPSAAPTVKPTFAPTPHACDNGTHGCDKGPGGICYKGEGDIWSCHCANGYGCRAGCAWPHDGHTCALTTPAPTALPTPATLSPTPSPTAVPTRGMRSSKHSTSLCSHLFCEDLHGSVTVYHSGHESFGDKHICKMNLHQLGKCGCECWAEDAAETDDTFWKRSLTKRAQQMLIESKQIVIAKLDKQHHVGLRLKDVHTHQVVKMHTKNQNLKQWMNWANSLRVDAEHWQKNPPKSKPNEKSNPIERAEPTPGWYPFLANPALDPLPSAPPPAPQQRVFSSKERGDTVLDAEAP